MTNQQHQEVANKLFDAEQNKMPIDRLTKTYPSMTVGDAYLIQHELHALNLENKRRHIGYKVGLTSKAAQAHFGVHEPDFGHLYDDMALASMGSFSKASGIAPKIEGEIAFVFSKKLSGPSVSSAEVIQAVDYVTASLEIIDSRIKNWDIGAADTIADNGSSWKFVLSNKQTLLRNVNLETLGMALSNRGEVEITASGAAIMGNPLYAICFLVKELHRFHRSIEPGMVVLSGSLGGMVAVEAKDHYLCEIQNLGQCLISITE